MVVLKLLSYVVAALLSYFAIKMMMRETQAVRVKATTRRTGPQQPRRLRQDPRTGIYYPEA